MRAFGESCVDEFFEGDGVIEHAGLHHQVDDRFEIGAARRQRLVFDAVDRVRQRPAQKLGILVKVEAPDEIGGVQAMPSTSVCTASGRLSMTSWRTTSTQEM